MEINSETSTEQRAKTLPSIPTYFSFMVLLLSTLNFCGYFRRREETSESSSLSFAKSLPSEPEVSLHNSAYRDVIIVRSSKARSVKDVACPDAAYTAMGRNQRRDCPQPTSTTRHTQVLSPKMEIKSLYHLE